MPSVPITTRLKYIASIQAFDKFSTIDDGISGLLCKPNNADSLLEKMNEAARMSKIQKQEIGKRAKKRIDQLAPEVVVSKLLRFYQYVIDHVSNNIK